LTFNIFKEDNVSKVPNEPAAQNSIVSDDEETPPEKVDYAKYRELLDEKKREQREKRELAEKVATFEKAQKDKEEELAKKRGDYETLIKTREDRIKELELDVEANKKHKQDVKKLSAFLKAAGDVEDKWIGLIDINQIAVNPDTGEVDQMSVAKAADVFKKTWPEAFKKPGVRMPTEAPNGAPDMITESAWKKLASNPKEMNKYRYGQIIWGQ
jgi:hypothetical protein